MKVSTLEYPCSASSAPFLLSDLGFPSLLTHSMPQFPKTEATVLSSFISIKRNINEDLEDFYSSKKST